MKMRAGVKNSIKDMYRKAFMKKKYVDGPPKGADKPDFDRPDLDTIDLDTIDLDTINFGKKTRDFTYEHSKKKLGIAGGALTGVGGAGVLAHKLTKKDSKMKKEAGVKEVKESIKNLYRKALMKKQHVNYKSGEKYDGFTKKDSPLGDGYKEINPFNYRHSKKKLAIAGGALTGVGGIGVLAHKSTKKDSKMKKEAGVKEIKESIKNLYRKALMKKHYLDPNEIKRKGDKVDGYDITKVFDERPGVGWQNKDVKPYRYRHSKRKLAVTGGLALGATGAGVLIRNDMKKEALLEDVYQSSFNDELEKISGELSENVSMGINAAHKLTMLPNPTAMALSTIPTAIGAVSGAMRKTPTKKEMKKLDSRGLSNILLSGFGVAEHRAARRAKYNASLKNKK